MLKLLKEVIVDISQQFYGVIKNANWIEESYDTIRNLKDKIKFVGNLNDFKSETDFWTIGPKKSSPGKYFIYWHGKRGSSEEEIKSITLIENTQYIMVFCSDFKWHKFDINVSAWNWARTMDLYLHGAYTDIPPLNIKNIIEYIKS